MGYNESQLKHIKFFADKDPDVILDSLTGVITRGVIIEYIAFLIDTNEPFSLFVLDVDNFKAINDELGHQTGDEILRRVADELLDVTSNDCIIGRYGGDEFLIVSSISEYTEKWNFCKKIFDGIRFKNLPSIKNNNITITMGGASFPNDAKTFDELFLTADKALYRGKKKGRNCFIVYKDELHKDIDLSNRSNQLEDLMISTYHILMRKMDLKENLKTACTYICNLFSLSTYFITPKGNITNISATSDISKLKDDLFKSLLGDEKSFVVNNYSKLMSNFPILHEYCWNNRIKSFIVLKVEAYDKFFGYLLVVDYNIKRPWQKDDKILFIYLSQILGLLLYNEK